MRCPGVGLDRAVRPGERSRNAALAVRQSAVAQRLPVGDPGGGGGLGDGTVGLGDRAGGIYRAVGEIVIVRLGAGEDHGDGDALTCPSVCIRKFAAGGIVLAGGQRLAVHQPGEGHARHGGRLGGIVGLGGHCRAGNGQRGLADG